MKRNLIIIFLLTNSLIVFAQEKLNKGKYLYEKESLRIIINIEDNNNFKYFEYYISESGKTNVSKKEIEETASGSGLFKMKFENLILEFNEFDSHGNQNTFNSRRDSMSFKLSELKKL
jgi:hypothetical protein